MPKIPMIISTGQVEAPQFPRRPISTGGMVPADIKELADTRLAIEEKKAKIRQATEVAQAQTGFLTESSEALSGLRKEPGDPMTLRQRGEVILRGIQNKYAKGFQGRIFGGREMGEAFLQDSERSLGGMLLNLQHFGDELFIDHQKADFMRRQEEVFSNLGGLDAGNRGHSLGLLLGELEALKTGGVIKDTEYEKEKGRLTKEFGGRVAEYEIMADPEGFLRATEPGTGGVARVLKSYPGLTGEDLLSYRGRATSEANRRYENERRMAGLLDKMYKLRVSDLQRRALVGELGQEEMNRLARSGEYLAEDVQKIQKAREGSGITDPAVVADYERGILQGWYQNTREMQDEIFDNRGLGREEKTSLIKRLGETEELSKRSNYGEGKAELRAWVDSVTLEPQGAQSLYGGLLPEYNDLVKGGMEARAAVRELKLKYEAKTKREIMVNGLDTEDKIFAALELGKITPEEADQRFIALGMRRK